MNNRTAIRVINEQETYLVPLLLGAADHLVSLREKKNVYNVNPHLKYWATFFLLKTISSSGVIHNWNKQKHFLLQYLRLSDGTFRSQLSTLKKLGLIEDYKASRSIILCSYKNAAHIMGIEYKGECQVEYKPNTYNNETQVFRYILVAQEVESNQDHQLTELYRKFQKNLSGKATDILSALRQLGYTDEALRSPQQFQQALLRLQKIVFRDKSGLADVAFSLRADINRSVRTWAKHHGYAHAQSASFLKNKFRKLKIADIKQECINSNNRCRLYFIDEEGNKRDGYKWNKKALQTAWRLCDQVTVQITPPKKQDDQREKKAA